MLTPGSRVGAYEVIASLGTGGMGEVYRARDSRLNRDVAIKVLPAAVANDPDHRARLEREAQALAALNHPNVGAIYGLDEQAGQIALIMELVDGVPLRDLIAAGGMPVTRAVDLAIQIARGLEAAHQVGIVHRDLKPSNVLVTKSNVAKIVDFGIAKILESPSNDGETATAPARLTEDGRILGTVDYMSPEQAQGRPIDTRSDIFSFGALFYEMIAGTPPFRRNDTVSTLAAILHVEPRAPSAVASTSITRDVDRVVLRCLRKDANRRFQIVSDLRIALEDLESDAPPAPVAPRNVAKRSVFWPIAITGAAVAVLAIVAAWLMRNGQQRPAWPLQQLTFDAGMSQMPALSPDGKLLAYVSDRSGEGHTDIWIKQVAGGAPIRITTGSSAKGTPQFSADATKVYYLSNDSIFEVSSLGGATPRPIIDNAGPFSVAKDGEIGFFLPAVLGPAPMYVVPPEGGARQAWHPECRSETPPFWSPEGDRAVFLGWCDQIPEQPLELRIKVAPRQGGAVRDLGALRFPFGNKRLEWFRLPNGQEGLLLPSIFGDAVNVYRLTLDGLREAVTHGTGLEMWPTVSSSGMMAFSRAEQTPAIWSVDPTRPDAGRLQEIAPGQMFDISYDGQKLVYGRMRGFDKGELVLQSRESHKEELLATHEVELSGAGSFWPQISPDGSQVVYRLFDRKAPGTYVTKTAGGPSHLVAPIARFGFASGWFPDGKRVIGECVPPMHGICQLDVETGDIRPLIAAPQGAVLLSPSFSWDGQWLVFMDRRASNTTIRITRVLSDGKFEGDSSWVTISPDDVDAGRPRFGPDGSSIFYDRARARVHDLVRQDLDPRTKHPVGAPISLSELRRAVDSSVVDVIAVTRNRVFFNSVEAHSNIWMTRLY